MRYKTPHDFEQALKAAARKSPQDTNIAIKDFYADRLLARVFSETPPSFILKGGRSMLARTINARRTLDTDFVCNGIDLNEAKEKLVQVARKDLDDFLSYSFTNDSKIGKEQEYRSGIRVHFDVYFGATKKVDSIKIDIVSDVVPDNDYELIKPSNVLPIQEFEIPTYYVFPKEHSIADKACALLQYFNGQESSRPKDLVDIVQYGSMETIIGFKLEKYIQLEAKLRHINMTDGFTLPDSWIDQYRISYSNMAKGSHLESKLLEIRNGYALVKDIVDPAINHNVSDKVWSPINKRWELY